MLGNCFDSGKLFWRAKIPELFFFKGSESDAGNCFEKKCFLVRTHSLKTISGLPRRRPEGAKFDPGITKIPYKTCWKRWFLVQKGPWRVLDQIRYRALRSDSQQLFWIPKIALILKMSKLFSFHRIGNWLWKSFLVPAKKYFRKLFSKRPGLMNERKNSLLKLPVAFLFQHLVASHLVTKILHEPLVIHLPNGKVQICFTSS